MEEKILTLHPQSGKQGVNISKPKYDMVKRAILDSLSQREMTFRGLIEEVENKLKGQFDGSISWYVTTVKLDLEARKIIERVPGKTPQHIRLTIR